MEESHDELGRLVLRAKGISEEAIAAREADEAHKRTTSFAAFLDNDPRYGLDKSGRGTKAEVEVDFSHGSLDGEWWAPNWHTPYNNGGLWYHWIAPELEQLEGTIRVEAGDRLRISHVSERTVDRYLEQLGDRELRAAWVTIERQGRTAGVSPSPIFFTHRRSVIQAPATAFFERVALRLGGIFQIDLSVRGPGGGTPGFEVPVSAAPANQAMFAVDSAWKAFDRLARQLDGLPEETRGLALVNAQRAINGAAKAGYFLAREEEERGVRPIVERDREQRKDAADKAAEVTSNKDWREGARAYWENHPEATLNAVAVAVKGDDDDLSSVRRSIRSICPPTSPSYEQAQKTLTARRWHKGGGGTPAVGPGHTAE